MHIILDLEVHAGHGLDFKTTKILNRINEIKEFNIGHFLISESIFFGLPKIIKKFKKILRRKMKILGIGVDIIENKRIKNLFKKKIFMKELTVKMKLNFQKN